MNATQNIVQELIHAYWMEIETVLNYLANSINLDGLRAEEVKKSLLADVTIELGHAQQLGKRIRVLGGSVPGSETFLAQQKALQPPSDSTNVVAVIKGVIIAEEEAIKQYNKIIRLCEGVDYPTQDIVITILVDEEEHRREFVGFLTEYEKRG